jgi:hypothetical protein
MCICLRRVGRSELKSVQEELCVAPIVNDHKQTKVGRQAYTHTHTCARAHTHTHTQSHRHTRHADTDTRALSNTATNAAYERRMPRPAPPRSAPSRPALRRVAFGGVHFRPRAMSRRVSAEPPDTDTFQVLYWAVGDACCDKSITCYGWDERWNYGFPLTKSHFWCARQLRLRYSSTQLGDPKCSQSQGFAKAKQVNPKTEL